MKEIVNVEDVKKGDIVISETDERFRVESVTKGWLHDERFLNYSNGQWSNLHIYDQVEIEKGGER